MKNVSFMVALLAVIQILTSSRLSHAQELRLNQDRLDRRTLEEALDAAGEDIGQELEELFEQLEITSEKLGQKIERWAEENSDELSAWSRKYGHQWEAFGRQFENTIESIADDQQGIWSRWAERYERDLESWSRDFEQDELAGESIGRFIDSNLEALSEMPLGELVDQVLEDGVSDLRDAPWESLEELGLMAKDALQEPLEELADLSVEGMKAKRAINRSTREMGRTLERFKDDIGQNISDSDLLELVDGEAIESDLRQLLEEQGITRQQRQVIQNLIDAIESSNNKSGQLDRWRSDGRDVKDAIQVPRRDQILQRIEREKKRHARALDEFNMDLQRSAEDSLENQRRKSDIQWRQKDQRNLKGPGGKNLDLSRYDRSGKTDQFKYFRDGDGRQPRSQKQNSNRFSNRKSSGERSAPSQASFYDDDEETEVIRALLRQVQELRKEVESLRRDRD